jgi:hypothetical protein
VTGLSGTGRVADDIYVMAHHDISGKPYVQPRALGLGLAGGLLAELMLGGHIGLWHEEVVAASRTVPGEGVTSHLLGLLASERERHPPRDWLLFAARTAAEDVARRLEHAGYLRRVEPQPVPEPGWASRVPAREAGRGPRHPPQTRLHAIPAKTASVQYDRHGRWRCRVPARLATLPTTSRHRGNAPPRRADRESASKVVDAATIIPSTDKGVSAATHPRLAMERDERVHVQVGNCARDQRRQRHAPGRRPLDPAVRAHAHDRLPTANSHDSTHWDLGAVDPANRTPTSMS